MKQDEDPVALQRAALTWNVASGCLQLRRHARVMYSRFIPRAPVLGNPSWYACWQDESLNQVLRTIAEHSKPQTFHIRIHQSFNLIGALRLNSYVYGSPDELDQVLCADDHYDL